MIWTGAAFAAAVAWTFVSAAASGGDPAPVALTFVIAAAGLFASHLIARFRPWIVPVAVMGGGIATGVYAGKDLLDSFPLSGPFGYVNARSAVFMLAAIGGAMFAAASRSTAGRALGTMAALGLAAVPFGSRTVAAAGLVVAAPALALIVRRRAALVFGVITALAIAGSIVVGTTYRSTVVPLTQCGPSGEHCSREAGGLQSAAVRLLGEARPRLWRESLVIAADHPLTGVGPGRFASASATAEDPDLRRAHNAFLQQAAEGGLPAFVALVAIFGMGFALLAGPGGPVAALAAAGLASTAILSSIDYVLHYPAVVAMASSLVGAGTAPLLIRDE